MKYHFSTMPRAVPSLQAAGGFDSPGPRRSARFANKQKPNSGSSTGQQSATPDRGQSGNPQRGQPGRNSAQAQLQRSWLQTFIWIAWAMLAVLVAVMAATNPSRAAFVDSISQLTSKGLGQWAGTVLLPPCVQCTESVAPASTNSGFAKQSSQQHARCPHDTHCYVVQP